MGIQMGCDINGSACYTGILDEVRIYRRALSDTEIQDVMNTPIGVPKDFFVPNNYAILSARHGGEPPGEGAATVPDASFALPSLRAETRNAEIEASGSETASARGRGLALEVSLSRNVYHTGQTVEASTYRLQNTAPRTQQVEIKGWLTPAGMAPISIRDASDDGIHVLPKGANLNVGPLKLLPVTNSIPRGTYEFGTRLIDPTTGDQLTEDIGHFGITSDSTDSSDPQVQSITGTSPLLSVQFENTQTAFSPGDVLSLPALHVANAGSIPTGIELKLWLESPTLRVIQVLSLGVDGLLVLPPASEIRFNPQASLRVTDEMTTGVYQLKARLLNPATGEITNQSLHELTVR
jgi:hypothetical protein